jgi:spermidine synthase
MSLLHLDRRPDGSFSLVIDGDLQFDSRDERIYHECLVLPALALARSGTCHGLRVLICGGGDGLAAREALKSPAVAHVDLVDYDPAVVELARTAWPELHGDAFADPRLTVHHADAWAFVAAAATPYDLIVVDLTVPQDVTSAAFHSVEWYERLTGLLTPTGALAVNGLSPSATPEAYWTPYNAMRTVGLHPKPYRIALPAFIEQGYGPDWGFFLAARAPITKELLESLTLATPRSALQDTGHLLKLFTLPAAAAEIRGTVSPVRQGDDTLLRRLGQHRPILAPLPVWDALADAVDSAPLPAVTTAGLLPEPVRQAMAEGVDGESLLAEVLTVMPALQPQHTRTMIETLLHDPARFLAPIDLAGLIDRLLDRAADLPARIVGELRHLKGQVGSLLSDTGALLRLGLRVVTVVVVVVIVANLVFPDSAYGKGGSTHVGGHDSFNRSSAVASQTEGEPTIASGGGFRRNPLGTRQTVDEGGQLFPSRRFRLRNRYLLGGSLFLHHRHHGSRHATPSDAPAEAESVFRLSPEADVLNDGRIAISLSDRTFLMLDGDDLTVIDTASGDEVMALHRPANLVFRLHRELDRQHRGLVKTIKAKQAWNAWVSWVSFAPWYQGDQAELAAMQAMEGNLLNALNRLGFLPGVDADPPAPPVAGSHELFTSVWLLPDASGVAVHLADGAVALLDEREWGALPGSGRDVDPRYPAAFRRAVVDVLTTMVKDADGTYRSLTEDQGGLRLDLANLERDRVEYAQIAAQDGPSESVAYGAVDIPVSEALRRTESDIAGTQVQLNELALRLADWPKDVFNARQMLSAFQRDRGPA